MYGATSADFTLTAEVPDPGKDEAVVTDAMILSAVQAITQPPAHEEE